MMTKQQQAVHCFSQGYNCAQSVLGTFCHELGMNKDITMKMTTGLGSGMRCGETCGAVLGALIVIGLKYGHGKQINQESKEKTHKLVADFEKAFIAKNGSLTCKDLLKYDLSKEDELAVIREKDLFNTICPNMVESAVEILEDLL